MNKKYIILICLIFTPFCYGENLFKSPQYWKSPEILKILKFSKVDKIESMKEVLVSSNKKIEFDGEMSLVTFSNGIKVVFKSCSP